MLAFQHYSHGGSGIGEWVARIVVRGAIYRTLWGLPLPVVLVAGAVALYVVHRATRRRYRRGVPARRFFRS